MNLRKLFYPKSIALIGASNKKGKLGHNIYLNLKSNNYKEKVFPVNIKGGYIKKDKIYKSILDIKQNIDLAIVVIPAQFVLSAIKKCNKKNIKNIVIISAGFKETGKQGENLEQQIKDFAKKNNINILGPNCLGFLNSCNNLNASFAEKLPTKGKIALISQSGAMAVAISDWALNKNIGFSIMISIGNKTIIDEVDILQFLQKDKNTEIILLYLESLERGKEFLKIASQININKTIIVLKAGSSKLSQKAIESHTGAMAGEKKTYDIAFKKAGIISVDTIEEFFFVAKICDRYKWNYDNKIFIITNAGGVGVMTLDAIENSNLKLQNLDKNTINQLKKYLPTNASFKNPLDIIGDATSERYKKALEITLKNLDNNTFLILLTPQIMTDVENIAKIIVNISKKYPEKNIFTCFLGGEKLEKAINILKKNKIINFNYPNDAIASISKSIQLKPKKISYYNPTKIIKSKNLLLNPNETEKILNEFKIPYPQQIYIQDKKEIAKLNFQKYKYVAKVYGNNLIHKIDLKGVILNIESQKKAEIEYEKLMQIKGAQGVLFQVQENGFEIILGLQRDSIFGYILLIGAGGIYTNILKDYAMTILPTTKVEIKNMIKKLKIYPIITGYRTNKILDENFLIDTLYKLSLITKKYKNIDFIDINPLFLKEKGGIAVDVKIKINK